MSKVRYNKDGKRVVIKKHFTPIGKLTLYGSLATIVASSGFKIAGDAMMKKYDKVNDVDETITQCENAIHAEKLSKLTVSKYDEAGLSSYKFDVDTLFNDLKPAILAYNHYNGKILVSNDDKEKYEQSLDTILESNDKIIEIFNELVKRKIASEIGASPENIDILYNNPEKAEHGEVIVKINDENIQVGTELNTIIEKYKNGLLITYDEKNNDLPLTIKEHKVERVLGNIREYRLLLKDLTAEDTKYISVSEDQMEGFDITYQVNSSFELTPNAAPQSNIKFLEVEVNRKNDEER